MQTDNRNRVLVPIDGKVWWRLAGLANHRGKTTEQFINETLFSMLSTAEKEEIKDPIRENITELHKEGLTDKEIAERLGVARSRVTYHRQVMKLPVNKKSRKPAKPVKTDPWMEKVQSLWEQGYTDKQISETLGLSGIQVRYRREKLSLPINRKPRKSK